MFCKQCGHEIREGAKFCLKCGAPVTTAAAPAQTAVSDAAPAQPSGAQTAPPIQPSQISPASQTGQVPPDQQPPRKKKKGPVIALVILIILLVLGGGFAAFWFLGGKPMITRFLDDTFGTSFSEETPEESEDEAEEEDQTSEKSGKKKTAKAEDTDEDDDDDGDDVEIDETDPSAEPDDVPIVINNGDTGERDETAEALRQRDRNKNKNKTDRSAEDSQPEKTEIVDEGDPVQPDTDDTTNDPGYGRSSSYDLPDPSGTGRSDADDDASNGRSAAAASSEEPIYEQDVEEYMIPDSDVRKITRSDLVGMSAWELRVARNEIYARHGRKFQDKELQAYFDDQIWYHGTIEPGNFSESMLNEIEKQNCITITDYEKEMGYR